MKKIETKNLLDSCNFILFTADYAKILEINDYKIFQKLKILSLFQTLELANSGKYG